MCLFKEGREVELDEYYIVDRIEEDIVVIEDINKNIININKSKICGDVNEGDCLIKKEEIFFIDIEETKKRKAKISDLMKGMWDY